MNTELATFCEWFYTNKLALNVNKTKYSICSHNELILKRDYPNIKLNNLYLCFFSYK